MATGDLHGDWQEVRRKKPFPANWRISQPTLPKSNPYIPYSKPTYAEVLRLPSQPKSMATATKTSPPTTQPNSPSAQANTVFYVSPHSPSRLRFPPSHTFPEWRGRCFRCCRTGHSAAKCRNPKRCGRCWAYGHIGSKCKQEIVPPPQPARSITKPALTIQAEPNFDELLTGSYPYRSPEMPKERSPRLHCFIPRDAEYYAEIERLKQAVVMHTGSFQGELCVDNVSDYACRTNLVTKEEIQVSELHGSRFLIILPEGLAPDTFINATPQEAWDEGLSFQPWTPLENAAISIPAYKILINLVGVPPHLFKEKYVAQAVCQFGVFLGSVETKKPSYLASWTVAVGVDDLSLVPPELVLHVGGMTHTVQTHTIAYQRAPIYTVDDIPKHPKTYYRPQPIPPSTSSSDSENNFDENEVIPMNIDVLKDLCRGRTAASLPPELRRFATVEEIDLDFTHMATHEMTTMDQPAQSQGFFDSTKSVLPQSTEVLPIQPHVTGQGEGLTADGVVLSHIQSQPNSSLIDPLQKERGINDTAVIAAVINDPVADPNLTNIRLPQQRSQATQIPKILVRGEPSKRKEDSVAAKSAEIQRGKPPKKDESMQIKKDIYSNQALIIHEKKSPDYQAPTNHVSQAQDKGMVFSAKGKAHNDGPLNGPYARKFKWVRPVPTNNAQVTKQIMAAASHKRKGPTHAKAGPNKKSQPSSSNLAKNAAAKGKKKAEVSFNAEGFYEVKVHYEHVSKLATGCGFTTSDIQTIIENDNDLRRAQATPLLIAAPEEEEPDSRFVLDPNDELTSEEEDA